MSTPLERARLAWLWLRRRTAFPFRAESGAVQTVGPSGGGGGPGGGGHVPLPHGIFVIHPEGAQLITPAGSGVVPGGGAPAALAVPGGVVSLNVGAGAVDGVGGLGAGSGAVAGAMGFASVLFAPAGAFVDDSDAGAFFADNFNDNSLGPEWEQVRGTFTEAASQLRVSTVVSAQAWLAYARRRWNTVDVTAKIVTAPNPSFRGVFAHASFDAASPKNGSGYVLRCNNGGMSLSRVDAGVFTDLLTLMTAPAAGQTMRLTIDAAGLLSCYSNGVFRNSTTDTTYKGGYAGIFSGLASIDFDDFSVDDTP